MSWDITHWFGLDYILNPQKRLYWGYLLSSGVIITLYLRLTGQSVTILFSKKIWWHASARLDYVYFLTISLIKLAIILPWMLSIREVSFAVLQLMESMLGYQPKILINRYMLMFYYTLALFLLSDFSRYWLHRLLHKIPLLWAFHKVHHSAEVLTPITFYRVHPVENILFGFRYALVAGLITGVFAYYFGATLAIIEILGINLFVVMLHFLGDNLRHSPVRLRYFDTLEKWLISPAQHQYHHTLQGNRYNYGGALAIWDRLFGTLRLSRQDDSYQFGITDSKHFDSVINLLLLPFINIKNDVK